MLGTPGGGCGRALLAAGGEPSGRRQQHEARRRPTAHAALGDDRRPCGSNRLRLDRRSLSRGGERRATRSGAVPPKLVRLATERSTRQHVVDRGGDARLDRLHLVERQLGERATRASARLTIAPVAWCAWRNGSPATRTSQSARSVAVAKPRSAALRMPLAVRAACRAPSRPWRRGRVRACRRLRTPAPCPPACPWHRRAAGPSSPPAMRSAHR